MFADLNGEDGDARVRRARSPSLSDAPLSKRLRLRRVQQAVPPARVRRRPVQVASGNTYHQFG